MVSPCDGPADPAGSLTRVNSTAGTRIDPYVDRYAARVHGMTASEIRALFAVASRPEIVSLAGGMPYVAALPLDAVGDLANRLITDGGKTALQYGSGQGDPRLRELICDVMALEGIAAVPEDVVVTVGSQQALDLVTRVFCDPGDVVLAEAPTYVGALGTFAAYQVEVVHVPMDHEGLRPDALEETISRLQAAGRRAKFLYTVPNYHNPVGVSLAARRRPEIVEVAARHDLLVLEDNPYGLLGFTEDPVPALRAVTDDRVLYLGSFSKTFAPGLRVGWVLAPTGVRERLVLASEATVLCPPTLTQHLVAEYLASQPWQEQIKVFREVYRERCEAMLAALAHRLPAGCQWTQPTGGFYVWVTLPAGLDTKAMLPRAVQERVAYVPGTAFYADGSGSSHARLSYCYPDPDRIREGVRRFAAVVEEAIELHATFGGPRLHTPHADVPQSPQPGLP